MAKINREYDGQTKLKEWWKIVRDNADLMNDQTEKHISGEADRHSADDVDYSGTVNGATTVKEAVETVHDEVAAKQNEWRVATSGTATAYTAVLDPAPEALYVGMKVTIIPHVTSASKNATLNINGFGAKPIRQRSSNTNIVMPPEAADFLRVGYPAGLMYDGNCWVMTEFSRPAWWDIRSKPDLLQPSNIKAGENVSVAVNGTNVTISAEKTPVEDILTSASKTSALSANQGKVLNEKIAKVQAEADGKLGASDLVAGDNVDIAVNDGKVTISAAGGSGGEGGVTIVDNLESTSRINALSANQGRVLDEKIDDLNSNLGLRIDEKADVSHEHTSRDITDFPTLCEGDNIVITREGNDLTISAPSVDDKLTADDIVAGENITLEKTDGKVKVSTTGSSFKVGDMLTTVRTDLDDSWLLCNGAGVSAEEYPELAEVCPLDLDTDWQYSYSAPCTTSGYSAFNEEFLAVPYSVNPSSTTYYGIAYTDNPASGTWETMYLAQPYRPMLSYENGYWIYILNGARGEENLVCYYRRDLSDGEWTKSNVFAVSGGGLARTFPNYDAVRYIGGYYVAFTRYSYGSSSNYIVYSPTIDFANSKVKNLSGGDSLWSAGLVDVPEKQKVILKYNYSVNSTENKGLFSYSYDEFFTTDTLSPSEDKKVADTLSLVKVNGKYISLNGNEILYKDSADGEGKTLIPDTTTTRNYANIAYANGYWLLHDSTNQCVLYSKDFEKWYVNTEMSNVSGGIMNSQNYFVALCGDTWRVTKPGEHALPTVAGGLDGYTYIKAK